MLTASAERKKITSIALKHRGTLRMRFGPMYSGKSTWLNTNLTEVADQGFSVLKIVHSSDKRDDVAKCDDAGSTHNSSYTKLTNKVDRVKVTKLSEVDISKYIFIGIDEAQFFGDLLEMVEKWIEEYGKHVFVVGLDGDSKRKKFGQVVDLIPLADEAIKLNARCRACLDEIDESTYHNNIFSLTAPFTKRKGTSEEQILIGGDDLYIPVCRYHYVTQ